MMNSISNRTPQFLELPISQRLQYGNQTLPNTASSFPELLQDGFMQVNDIQLNAQDQVHELLSGGDVSKAEVFTAVQKADMAFQMLVQVRNKLMAAYDEINNIRI